MEKGGLSVKKTIILAYHDIDSKDSPTEKKDLPTIETVVRCEEFESHMNYLAGEGWTVLSVEQYLSKKKNGGYADKDKVIVLTFDDGHISNYRFALPILRKYSFYATFYIIADFIGKPYYMGMDEIRELLNCNMEIGSHSRSHSYLTELKQEEIDKELVESKNILQKCCGKRIDGFAYPGGHQNRKVVESVKTAGYKAAVSCLVGQNNAKTNPFLLRRIEVRRGTSLKDFKNAINPMNITFFQCVDMGKFLMKKTLGLKNYEFFRQRLYYLYPFKR